MIIVTETDLPLKVFKKGKVRDAYETNDKLLLIVTLTFLSLLNSNAIKTAYVDNTFVNLNINYLDQKTTIKEKTKLVVKLKFDVGLSFNYEELSNISDKLIKIRDDFGIEPKYLLHTIFLESMHDTKGINMITNAAYGLIQFTNTTLNELKITKDQRKD